MSIILFIIILAILILAHEFGHFIVAKKSGIRVDEFGIGFPPKVYGKKFGETEYTVNALPFGGFVKIFGEDPDQNSISGPEAKRSFVNQPKLIKIAVLSAGVFFNLLLAWLLISASMMLGSAFSASSPLPNGQWVETPKLMVVEVAKDSPAEKAGIRTGDTILSSIDTASQEKITAPTPESFQNFIGTRDAKEISINLQRGEEKAAVVVTPQQGIVSGKPAIGIAMDMVGTMKLSPPIAVIEGAKLTYLYTIETFKGIFGLLHDSFYGKADLSQVSGPVGIVKIVGDASKLGLERLLALTAIISINLAVVNILPIPALDGGRVFFVLIEAIKRSPIKPQTANTINTISFLLLVALIIIITFNDVWKLLVG
ncbi:MAG: M50 family metallopeptidase [Candidatus Paceibacterota bacterium]|nr:M50 family metallopeptidase [Candidatus Paceibacterota bacterium]